MSICSHSFQSQAYLHQLPQLVNVDDAVFSSIDFGCLSLDVFTNLSGQLKASRQRPRVDEEKLLRYCDIRVKT